MAEDFQEQVHGLQGFEIRKKGKSIHLWISFNTISESSL